MKKNKPLYAAINEFGHPGQHINCRVRGTRMLTKALKEMAPKIQQAMKQAMENEMNKKVTVVKKKIKSYNKGTTVVYFQ